MVKKLLVALVVAALVVGALVWLASQGSFGWLTGTFRRGTTGRVLEQAPWEPYGYQLREGPRARSYNVPIVIKTPPDGKPIVRVVVDLQDRSNYYFAELTSQHTRLCKVESGLETPLGHSTSPGLRPGTNKLVVKRRYDSIVVVLNDVVAAWAEDESFHGGSIGAGVLGDSAQVKVGAPQPCDPIAFEDDFMESAANATSWKTLAGSWRIATLNNPSLSTNAFYYVGNTAKGKGPAATVCGEWFWDNYLFRAAAMSKGSGDVGIYFYYRDPDNCYLFRWNADKQPGLNVRGRKQLIKRWHGQETLLAEAPGGYQPGVWYKLEAEVIGSRIRTFIDGQQIFSVSDPALCFGKVGLHTTVAAPANAEFDDVLVYSVRGFSDDFSRVVAGRWRPLGGSWEQRVADKGLPPASVVVADAPAKAVAGSTHWRNYTMTAAVRLPKQMAPPTEVGLVTHYQDETNHVIFAWQPAAGTVRLEALAEGKRVASETAIAHRAPPSTRHILSVKWTGSVALASLDGQPVVSAWVPNLPQGAVGLYAAHARKPRFEEVHVAFPVRAEPVPTTHKIFSRELSMEVWAGAASDWHPTTETLDGTSAQVNWHRADFFGDATMNIEIRGDAAKAAAAKGTHRCRLVLSADPAKGVASGYNFVFSWPGRKQPAATAVILRGGEKLAEHQLPLASPVRRLRFQRLGQFLVASVNDRPVLAARDTRPPDGCRAAFATHGLPVRREDVTVFSDNVRVCTFSQAPYDWRAAAGTWEVRNRWECDPRWSFFSGVPEKPGAPPSKKAALAAIWHKYAFEGDVSVEFAVGPKMETARGGTAYKYTRDFNVVLCADGKDLNSGYGFFYGGWDNKQSAITRGNTIVAKSSTVIPRSSGIHRRWFYLKAERRGSTLNFYLDGNRLLTYTDPNPLPGNRVGIWTWGNGIMVARVRISAERIRGAEPPGTPSGTCHTIYNP